MSLEVYSAEIVDAEAGVLPKLVREHGLVYPPKTPKHLLECVNSAFQTSKVAR
jgi:hypothetical protein